MIANKSIRKSISIFWAAALVFAMLPAILTLRANAEGTQEIVTEYSDLWTGTVSAKVGVPVKWYVHVPDDTEPKGCSATVKIPGLGWGTETNNNEDEYVTLTKGDNLVYEFTPEEAGDFIFTCRMGSGCHSNYIHITEDGTYNVPKPEDPTEITAEREGTKVTVGFHAPEAPEGAVITGYKATATDENGSRKKASGSESPIVFENLDESKTYTIKVITLSTSGTSAGENEYVLNAAAEVTEEEDTAEQAPAEDSSEDNNAADNSSKAAAAAPTPAANKKAAAEPASSPKTGSSQPRVLEALLISSVGLAFLMRKKTEQ